MHGRRTPFQPAYRVQDHRRPDLHRDQKGGAGRKKKLGSNEGPAQPQARVVTLKTELTFDQEFVDFGVVQRGEKREHTFTFTNTGTVPVEIDLISSCDCTTAEYDEGRVYQPGDSGELHIIFDSTEKEESETVDIDVILKNTDERGNPVFYILQYKFELIM